MDRPYILHMFTPGRQMSPFDINMAADAGYQVIVPYCEVDTAGIAGFIQDTIFSRSPKGLLRTGVFIGGRDPLEAADMLDKAKASMFKPFMVSLMADPSGAYTTAGAMVACVEAALASQQGLKGQRVVVLGGTGPVGRIAGVLAAQAGAQVFLSSRRGAAAAEALASETGKRFGVTLHGAAGGDDAAVRASISEADVLLSCAAAGVQTVSAETLAFAKRLKVAADVNAVPPEGIAGVGVRDNLKPLPGTAAVGIGALAIGNAKYQTQQRLLLQMHDAEAPLVLSFPEAFATARAFLAEKAGMTALAVVAISARLLAEAAAEDGFDVVALDLFGDTDTRRASFEWHSVGEPASLSIDGERLLPALKVLAQRGRVAGWIAGSGFEGRPDLLERGAALLPLVGTQAGSMRRVREPETFFGFLASHGIAHPAVRTTAPEDPDGWLVKDAHGCGGWHIRRAASHQGKPPSGPASAHHYFQREAAGKPMSATFIANGSDASVLGFNQLIVRPLAGHPFVFCGAVGPVALPANVEAGVTAMVRALAAGFSLRGLGSLDFLLDGDAPAVLEVNPRPPASMALYGPGMVAAHLRACLQGELPQRPARFANDIVRGTEVVFAPRRLRLDQPATQRLAARADCHDLPLAATVFEAGDPLCSVSASGTDAGQVRELLQSRRKGVHDFLGSAG